MNTNGRKTSPRGGLFRTGILLSAGAVILSTGMVVTLQEPAPPPAPTFSEQALIDAYEDAGLLRSAGAAIAGHASLQTPLSAQLGRTVTLLTVQEKALYRPLPEPAPPTPSVSATATTPPPDQVPAAVSAFLAELAASAGERLKDAEEADGATARLLAAAGTGQLLEARSLATLSGVPLPAAATVEPVEIPAPTAPATVAPPTAEPSPGCSSPASASASAEAAAALTAVLEAERQGDYGYTVALPRLPAEAVSVAEAAWLEHRVQAGEATSLLSRYCLDAPAPAAGYALGTEFLASPAGALAALEAGALPLYGDLIAFSEGTVRQWAVRSLLEGAERASGWGADTGALPGVAVQDAELPRLPWEPSRFPSPGPSPGPSAAP